MNRIRQRWDGAEVAVDCWLTSGSPAIVEAVGRLGYDSVLFDLQHTALDYRDVVVGLVALTGTGTAGLVRVAANVGSDIERVLDAGADGVVCPMINTRAEAERFVAAVRYPPAGRRSAGAWRTAAGFGEYFRTAGEDVLAIAQIETVEALGNLEAIAATPGLDALYTGPVDLSISLGGAPAFDPSDPVMAGHHREVARAAHAAGKHAGMLALRPGTVTLALEWGMDMISVAVETQLVLNGAAAALAQARRSRTTRDETSTDTGAY